MKINSAGVKIVTFCYVLVLAAIIFIADKKSTSYLLDFIGRIPYGDKFGHFFLMGGLSFLVNLLLRARAVRFGRLRILIGSLLVTVVVTIEEFSQLFVRGRTFDWSDLVADLAGIIVFGELAALLHHQFLAVKKF